MVIIAYSRTVSVLPSNVLQLITILIPGSFPKPSPKQEMMVLKALPIRHQLNPYAHGVGSSSSYTVPEVL